MHRCCASMEAALASPAAANPIVSGNEIEEGGEVAWITSPHDRRVVVGTCRTASPEAIDSALDAAKAACERWDRRGGEARAATLDRAADLFEAGPASLMALMVREAGKTLAERPRRSSRGGRSFALLGGGSPAAIRCPARAQGPDRRAEPAIAARARRVRGDLAMELPARHLHRADRRSARRRQCGGG